MGSANTRSRRLELLEVPDFALARFPVRIADYVTFLQALSEEERRERWPGNIDGGEPYLVYEGGRFALGPKVLEGPGRARVTGDAELALPIANVRWYDAIAYAHWLSQETGLPYRLPTDLEWEKAMRGADGRAFPTGTALDPSFAKLRESRPEPSQPEPVGAFPLDESPYGVRDLAGGLGDWTSTSIDGHPLPSFTECGSPEADERQAIWRGGTWSSTAFAQRDMRYAQPIRSCAGWIGFRLALSLEGRPSSQLLHVPMKR